MSTMARRISKSLNNDYEKAIRIARTEVHRVREAGFHDSAENINESLKRGKSNLKMVKIWRTVKDERVRNKKANHRKMEGQTVGIDEYFDLGGGVKTKAPGQSGDAKNDINCRCFLEYDLVEVIDKSTKNGIIKNNNTYKMDLGFFGKTKLEKADKNIKKLAKRSPIEIPKNAQTCDDNKPTYKQQIFSWVERDKKGKEIEYISRWHERTSNAPKENGETWVVVRKNKATGYLEHLIIQDNKSIWISNSDWRTALQVTKNPDSYSEEEVKNSEKIIKNGHIKR